jgi:hypothetical protein
MASEAQTTANRANAQRSTGPKTQKGKKKSSRNALKHGLSAASLVVLKETVEDYEDFAAAMRQSLRPQGAVEEQLFERVVLCAWRLRRVSRVEAALIRKSADELRRENYGSRLPLDEGAAFHSTSGLGDLARLEAGLERSFERAFALLLDQQRSRQMDEEEDEREALHAAAALAIPRTMFPRATDLPSPYDDGLSRSRYDDGFPSKHLSDYPEELRERNLAALRHRFAPEQDAEDDMVEEGDTEQDAEEDTEDGEEE